MKLISLVSRIYYQIQDQNTYHITREERMEILNSVSWYLNNGVKYDTDIQVIGMILLISNSLYNNSDLEVLLLEDGVYDLLLELCRKYVPQAVGAMPVEILYVSEEARLSMIPDKEEMRECMMEIDNDYIDNMMYKDEILYEFPLDRNRYLEDCMIEIPQDISKREKNKMHNYPKLVGTLDKCKFVMNYQADQMGVLNQPNVKVVERDFFAKHIASGILDPNRVITAVFELKYDGVSSEGDMGSFDYSSRGDAIGGNAVDLTPILRNYKFPYAPKIAPGELGVKFEVIMTKTNLDRYNKVKGKNYKNCRTAISGLFGALDAYNYVDFMTLVPLETSLDSMNVIEEIEFMNKYYCKEVPMIYAVAQGTYKEILFQLKQFVEEAEFARDYIDYMYDGVVMHYVDEDIRKALGRIDAVNQYSIAVKFNASKKTTTFLGYTFTVGVDGTITPMCHFEPVEFFGTIHPKTTGHSLERFRELNLKIGDLVDISYNNDCICYITAPDIEYNRQNPNPYCEFPSLCPECGSSIVISKSGKSAKCPNVNCVGRVKGRIGNMLAKLDFKDFGEDSFNVIGIKSFKELMTEVDFNRVQIALNSEILARKFMDRLEELRNKPLFDFDIIGSLGFDNIGRRKWETIFKYYTIQEILNMSLDNREVLLKNIKGIGPAVAETINQQIPLFLEDINYIINMNNVRTSKGSSERKKIRITGFRNGELLEKLTAMGFDASDSSVTKDTYILLVPTKGHTSSKTKKAGVDTLIMTPQELLDNLDQILLQAGL